MNNFQNQVSTSGIHENTYKLLFSDYHLSDDKRGSSENEVAIKTIHHFTKLEGKSILTPFDKEVLLKIKFNKETRLQEYSTNDLLIEFEQISSYIMDKKLVDELTSNERYHKCHFRSIYFSRYLINSKIVTGYATIGKLKFLHTVIQTKHNDGKTFIFDWTGNLIMEKQQYTSLTNFIELCTIDQMDSIRDSKIIPDNLSHKFYLTFRDEIVKDMLKNSQLFDDNNSKKHSYL